MTDDKMAEAAPCEGMPAAASLDHFLGLSLAFTWAARKNTPPGASSVTALAHH